MKQHVSKFLKSVAIFYMGFPVFYLMAAVLLFDLPSKSCARVLLSPWYYLVSGLAVAVGYGFWEVRRWSWYAFVGVNVLIAYENALMAFEYGESQHRGAAFVFSLFLLALLTARVAREIRVPYFFPKIRWWESNPRYRLSVPAKVGRAGGVDLSSDILDLSLGGCFLKLRADLQQDEEISLDFTVFGILLQLQGVVVWRTQSTVTHPKGVGIKFQRLSRAQKRSLRIVNQRLRKIATFYRRSRYLLNQDEFLKKLQELESRPIEKRKSAG